MASWKGFKTAAALLLAVTGLSLAPTALAEAAYPPTGKYYNTINDKVVWYDSTTKLVYDLEETVDPYECPPISLDSWEYAWAPDTPVECGNCLYVPDGSATWKLATTAYTVGRCLSLDPIEAVDPALDVWGVTKLRVDVRIEDQSDKYRWYAEVTARSDGFSGPNPHECFPNWDTCAPKECVSEQTMLWSRVHFCGEGPKDVDVRGRPWFSEMQGQGRICTYVRIERLSYDMWQLDSHGVVCEFGPG